MRHVVRGVLDSELTQADAHIPNAAVLQAQWKGMVWPAAEKAEHDPATGIAHEVLERVGRASVTVPSGFVRSFVACPGWPVA